MKKTELVFIPTPGTGHLTSTITLAKLLTDHNDHLWITVLAMRFPNDETPIAESSNSRVRFLELRKEESSSGEDTPPHMLLFKFIESHMSHVREILAEITNLKSSFLAGVILDMFCTCMIDVANEFGIPSYLFYSSGAAFLGLVFHMQNLKHHFNVDLTKYKDSDETIAIPTYINPVHTRVFPSGIFDDGNSVFPNLAKRYRETKGIIVNTFLEFESHAIQALSDDESIPPIYTIGPLLNLNGIHDQNREGGFILKWLDLQPDSSVVFLCFGSLGSFDADQVKEIAFALQLSGHRFLWSLRKPPPKGQPQTFLQDYENPEEVLPKGFLQQTADIGKVIGWAPQMAVLSHPALGGFVSHCGWNSTLESVWCGVPMAAWPIAAEQQVNAFQLVKDLGLAVEIKIDYRKDLGIETVEIVSADVIESGIRKLMDPENGIRNKVKAMQQKSRLALVDGGSSSASLRSLLNNLEENIIHH